MFQVLFPQKTSIHIAFSHPSLRVWLNIFTTTTNDDCCCYFPKHISYIFEMNVHFVGYFLFISHFPYIFSYIDRFRSILEFEFIHSWRWWWWWWQVKREKFWFFSSLLFPLMLLIGFAFFFGWIFDSIQFFRFQKKSVFSGSVQNSDPLGSSLFNLVIQKYEKKRINQTTIMISKQKYPSSFIDDTFSNEQTMNERWKERQKKSIFRKQKSSLKIHKIYSVWLFSVHVIDISFFSLI